MSKKSSSSSIPFSQRTKALLQSVEMFYKHANVAQNCPLSVSYRGHQLVRPGGTRAWPYKMACSGWVLSTGMDDYP